MANINQYNGIIKELEPRLEALNKAIELDPENTINYQSTIEHVQRQIDAAHWIIEAEKLVNPPKEKETKSEEEKPKKATKKKPGPKPVEEPKVEPVPAVEEEQTDIFDMFGD